MSLYHFEVDLCLLKDPSYVDFLIYARVKLAHAYLEVKYPRYEERRRVCSPQALNMSNHSNRTHELRKSCITLPIK